MAMNTSASNLRPLMQSGLVERLVSEQLMSSAGAAEIAEQARTQGVTLIQELNRGGHIESTKLARLVSPSPKHSCVGRALRRSALSKSRSPFFPLETVLAPEISPPLRDSSRQ